MDDKEDKQDVAQGISALINGVPGAAAARKKAGAGARKPGVPKFRKKRRKKRRSPREEGAEGVEEVRRGVEEMKLGKEAPPRISPRTAPADAHGTRAR